MASGGKTLSTRKSFLAPADLMVTFSGPVVTVEELFGRTLQKTLMLPGKESRSEVIIIFLGGAMNGSSDFRPLMSRILFRASLLLPSRCRCFDFSS